MLPISAAPNSDIPSGPIRLDAVRVGVLQKPQRKCGFVKGISTDYLQVISQNVVPFWLKKDSWWVLTPHQAIPFWGHLLGNEIPMNWKAVIVRDPGSDATHLCKDMHACMHGARIQYLI